MSHTYRIHMLVLYKGHKTGAYENFAFLSLSSPSIYLKIRKVKLLDNIQFHYQRHNYFNLIIEILKETQCYFLYLTYLSSYE